jgi:hypothetical protein
MLVVDASCLCEVVLGGADAEAIRHRLSADADHVAPPRHRARLGRHVRGARQALDAVLLTTDRRLAAATGPTCSIELVDLRGA